MKINDTQAAVLSIQLSTIGQVKLDDNDHELLNTLEYLLDAALSNVRKALKTQETNDPH